MPYEWYILQFKANSHYQASKNLNQQGFKTFLPTINTTSRKISRFTNTTQPLFPGYMFVKFDKTESEWQKINNTYGVSRLIIFNNTLKSVPSIFVNNLMYRCDSLGNLLPIEKLNKGDQVKISKGPFADFIATVETYETEQRTWVLMDLMGRKIKMQISSSIL